MKEAMIVGLVCGLITVAAFATGLHLGEKNAVSYHCEKGQLYMGVGSTKEDMIIGEVIYPEHKKSCGEA